MAAKKVILAGGTGLVGNLLLELLIQDQNYSEIVLLSRQDLSSSGKVKVVKTNFEDLESIGEEINGDECFCCLGTTMKKAGSRKTFYKIDHNYPLKLARIAAKNGIGKYLIVTSLGANPRSSFYYNRVKGEVEDSISKLDYKSIHIFRPSLILGKRNEKRTAETIGKYFSFLIAPLMVGPLKKYRPIKASDIAQAMLRIAHKNEDLEINPFEMRESGMITGKIKKDDEIIVMDLQYFDYSEYVVVVTLN